MKIIHLIYSLGSGGAEKFTVTLANEQARQGHDVTVCQLLSDNDDRYIFNLRFLSNGVKHHSLGFTSGFSLAKAFKTCRYIIAQRPDIVHCHLNVIPYIFPISALNNNIKFIHTIHSIASKSIGIPLQFRINRWMYNSKRIFPTTISEECRRSFTDTYKINEVEMIENGCAAISPTEKYNTVKAEICKYRNGTDCMAFIHVARFHPAKNQSLLIDSFNELNRRGIKFTLLVLGQGFDSEEASGLVEKACDNIHFLGEKSNVADYLLCADAFCLSSIYEGLPISLLEALSAGVTPICTAAGGIPNVITDGKTGYISNDFSVESYTDTIIRAMNAPIAKEKLTKYFEHRYSMRRCADEYSAIYSKIKSR